MTLSIPNSWKTPPAMRARNMALLQAWKQKERMKSHSAKTAAHKRQAIKRVLYEFSPENIPMAASLVKWKALDQDSIFWMIVTLNIDSYFLDCLQTLRTLRDAFQNPVLLSDELMAKIQKMSEELGIALDATSLHSPENFIDDFLDALILMKNTFVPNKESDLSLEFDMLLIRYFGDMSAVKFNTAVNNFRDKVMSFSFVDPDKLRWMEAEWKDIRWLKATEDAGLAEIEFTRGQLMWILGERIERRA